MCIKIFYTYVHSLSDHMIGMVHWQDFFLCLTYRWTYNLHPLLFVRLLISQLPLSQC